MSENPYQSPREQGGLRHGSPSERVARTVSDPFQIRIEDDCLVAPTGIQLPNRCVITNEPTPSNCERRNSLYWAPAFARFLWIFLGPLGVLYYSFRRERCVIRYSLTKYLRQGRTKRFSIVIFISMALFAAIPLVALYTYIPMSLVVLLWLISLYVIVRTARGPLRIRNADQGMFWIHGFCPEYLYELADSIAEEAAQKKASESSD